MYKLLTEKSEPITIVDKTGISRKPGLIVGKQKESSKMYKTEKEESGLYNRLNQLSIFETTRKYMRPPVNPQGLRIKPKEGYNYQCTKFPRLIRTCD